MTVVMRSWCNRKQRCLLHVVSYRQVHERQKDLDGDSEIDGQIDR